LVAPLVHAWLVRLPPDSHRELLADLICVCLKSLVRGSAGLQQTELRDPGVRVAEDPQAENADHHQQKCDAREAHK
jgi:hypothetical protein